MGTNPRIVTEDRWIFWDGVTQRLPKRQVMDVPPGSALERAIGAEFLVPLGAVAAPVAAPAQAAEKPAEEAPAEKPQQEAAPAPAKPAAAAKKQDSGKDGDS